MSQRVARILASALAAALIAVPAVACASVAADPLTTAKAPTLVVAVHSAADMASVRAAVERAGGTIAKQYRWNALLVSAPWSADATAFARAAGRLRGVRYAARTGILRTVGTANDYYYVHGFQWGTTRIGADTAWDVTQGDGIAIAEIDTGIDYNHEDLTGGRVVSFYDYVNHDTDAMDDDPSTHGTHVAGILAATRNNTIDIAGTAPHATVYALKVIGADGTGTTNDAVDAIRGAADSTSPRFRIITMSIGAPAAGGGNDPALRDAVAYARSKGILVVAAAGNSGSSSELFYPAAFPGVVGVGATDKSDGRASFSNYAPGLVDLAAPGVNIWSTVNLGNGARVAAYNGTSMATPFVSASAALVMARYPSLTATQVVDLLQSTAQDLGTPGKDDSFGWGLVRPDVAATLYSTPDAYEPDDTSATAHAAVLGASYVHTLAPNGDTDYRSVALIAGRTYRFETSALLAGADTALDVVATDGVAVLATNDDRSATDKSSLLTFTAPAAGTYFSRVRDPHSLGGGYTVRVSDVTASLHVTRLAGATRYDTAVLIAKSAYPGWAGVTDIVLTSGEDAAAADPLSAAGLCALYRAPLLITQGSALSHDVAAAIAEMPGTVRVHIVGGAGSVRPAVEAALGALPKVSSVERISGAHRYALAAAVAARVRAEASTPPTVALVANGAEPRTFFDALALSAVSARTGFPILLVRPNAIPGATAAELTALAPAQTWVAGGTGTVSASVYAGLHATGRWSGATRYDTARAVADGAISKGWLKPDGVGLAAKVPDALTGGSALGSMGWPVLVTGGSSLSAQPASFLAARRNQLWAVDVLGGTGSITGAVQTSVLNTLR